MLILLNA